MAFLRSRGILNASKGFFGGVVEGGGATTYPNFDSLFDLSYLRVRWTGNRSRGSVHTSVRNGTFYDPGNPFSINHSWEVTGLRNVGATGFEIEYNGSFINPAYVPLMSVPKWGAWRSDYYFNPGYDDPANHFYGSLWESIIGDAADLADSEYAGLPNPCLLRMFIGWDKYYWLNSRWPLDDRRPTIAVSNDPVAVLNSFTVFVP